MNSFYLVIELLRSQLAKDIDVNTITHGVVNNVDIDKKNIFPLAHIGIVSSPIQDGVILFSFEIHVLDQRNISKKPVTDKFLGNDNELDNLNTCHAVLNRLITWLKLQRNDYDIELVSASELLPVQFDFTNILDGWYSTVQVSIPNNIIVC